MNSISNLNKNDMENKEYNYNNKSKTIPEEGIDFKYRNYARKISTLREMESHQTAGKQIINWFNYICYKLRFKKNDQNFKLFEDLRYQIISEENLFKNNFDLFKIIETYNLKTDVN